MSRSKQGYRQRIYGQDPASAGRARSFDRGAAAHWARPYRKWLKGWLPGPKTATIVDIGCGAGRLLYYLRSLGYQSACGVDLSPDQVATARLTGATVSLSDANSFLLANPRSFDTVIGLDLIEHLTKDEAFDLIDAAFGSLQPGGRIVLQTPNAESPWSIAVQYGDLTHENFYTPGSLGMMLELAGFADVQVREQGPTILGSGLLGVGRAGMWQLLRAGMLFRNLIETGASGSGILSRVFLISAAKPDPTASRGGSFTPASGPSSASRL